MRLRTARTPPGPGGSTSSPATSGWRTCGRSRRRAAADDFLDWWQVAASLDPSQSSSALYARSSRSGGRSGGCSAGTPGGRPRLQGADAPRPFAGDLRDAPSGPTSTHSRSRRCTCSTTSGRRRSPTGPCTGSCTSAGSRRDRRLSRPDGRPGEANGLLRDRLHGRDRPFRHLIVYRLRCESSGGPGGGPPANRHPRTRSSDERPADRRRMLRHLGAALHGVGGEVLVC
jgi:hypothetical protein